MELSLIIVGIVLCVIFSAFFSATEMSFSSCNEMRLENDAKDGKKSARKAIYITEHFDDALSTILIGNNLVNIAASSLSSVLVIIILRGLDYENPESYTWISTVLITVLVIIFGETIPKITAKNGANAFALFSAPILRFLMIIFFPLTKIVVGLINLITKGIKTENEINEEESVEELQSIIETAEDEGVLDKEKTDLIHAAIDFEDISAFEVMTARVDVEAIDIEDSLEEILEFVENTHYTRIPVYEGSIDHVIGIVHLNRLLKTVSDNDDLDLRSIMMEPCFVYKTTKLPKVLSELREKKQHLAIVTDEYAGTLGVISMEDVLEQLVGEIWDENDVIEKEIIKRDSNEFEVDGDMIISDFLDLVHIDEDEFECDSDTVGGFVIETLGSFPVVGDKVFYENIRFKVLRMDERRVDKVLITIQPKEEV